jgi:hypothetical protein
MIELNALERATVLAALRFWQDEMLGHRNEQTDLARSGFPEHFADHDPLTYTEVNALCERQNVGDGAPVKGRHCRHCGWPLDAAPEIHEPDCPGLTEEE